MDISKGTSLEIFPITLKQANEMIEALHRHHKPVVGHRFSLGARGTLDKKCVGVVVVGRPVARAVSQYEVAEVTRLCTDGTRNACSILYAAASRVCREMGFRKIQTYILSSEPGTSLLAAGWKFEANTAGGDWNNSSRKGRRVDQPMEAKKRWAKEFF